jgi:hypothetical protein
MILARLADGSDAAASYPRVQIELWLAERRINVVGGRVDLAVCMGALDDST